MYIYIYCTVPIQHRVTKFHFVPTVRLRTIVQTVSEDIFWKTGSVNVSSILCPYTRSYPPPPSPSSLFPSPSPSPQAKAHPHHFKTQLHPHPHPHPHPSMPVVIIIVIINVISIVVIAIINIASIIAREIINISFWWVSALSLELPYHCNSRCHYRHRSQQCQCFIKPHRLLVTSSDLVETYNTIYVNRMLV